MKTNPALAYIKQLNIVTGATHLEDSTNCETVFKYFQAITILNVSAHLYDVVYLATPAALELLKNEVL